MTDGRYELGGRAAHSILYYYDRYPSHMIGPIEIIWNPEHADMRRMWIRIHPAIYNEAWDALKLGITRISGTSSKSVHMRDLRGEIEAFEITGPRASMVLRRILRLAGSEKGVKAQFFDSLTSVLPSEVPENMVVGLRVHDPRLQ